MRLSLGALIAGGLLVVACSGSSDDPVESSVSPSAAATTEPAVQTTTPAVTDPPATDPPPTSEPAPATTEQSTEALIAEIEADLNEGEQAFLAGAGDPGSEESRTNLARYFTGRALANLLGFYDELVSQGFIARPSEEIPSTVRVLEVLAADSERATVIYCRIDAGVVVDPRFGGEIIVNDAITRYDTRTVLDRIDGVWVITGGQVVDEFAGVFRCD